MLQRNTLPLVHNIIQHFGLANALYGILYILGLLLTANLAHIRPFKNFAQNKRISGAKSIQRVKFVHILSGRRKNKSAALNGKGVN